MNFKQTLITDYFKYINKSKKIYGYNIINNSWHCLTCGIDMGINNPRQLCGKTFCRNFLY
jgi:hypothetical protein